MGNEKKQRNGRWTALIMAVLISVVAVMPAFAASFSDVQSGDWFKTYVDYAYEKGIMSGTSDTTFEPNREVSRAMAVQVLYALEGKPSVTRTDKFQDLTDEWYQDAVSWAAANGIVAGTGNETFSPDVSISREQIVLILKKYAEYKGYDTSVSKSLTAFPDRNKVSGYATDAMKWAVAAGVISGQGSNGKKIAPQDGTKRCEFAAIMKSFNEKVATTEEKLPNSVKTGSIESQVIYDENDIIVTATGLNKDDYGMITLSLSVVNNSSRKIILQADDVYVNGYSTSNIMSETVMPGKKATAEMTLLEKYLLQSKISKIGTIEFRLIFVNPNTFGTLFKSDLIEIHTNQYGTFTQKDYDTKASNILLEQDGVTIYQEAFYNADPANYERAKLRVFIKNDSDRTVIVQCDDTSINDYMVSEVFSATVLPGKKIVDDIEYSSTDMQKYGITKGETLETKFSLITENFHTFYESDPIAVDLTSITKSS